MSRVSRGVISRIRVFHGKQIPRTVALRRTEKSSIGAAQCTVEMSGRMFVFFGSRSIRSSTGNSPRGRWCTGDYFGEGIRELRPGLNFGLCAYRRSLTLSRHFTSSPATFARGARRRGF